MVMFSLRASFSGKSGELWSTHQANEVQLNSREMELEVAINDVY